MVAVAGGRRRATCPSPVRATAPTGTSPTSLVGVVDVPLEGTPWRRLAGERGGAGGGGGGGVLVGKCHRLAHDGTPGAAGGAPPGVNDPLYGAQRGHKENGVGQWMGGNKWGVIY